MLCSHSPNDVPAEPQLNVSISAVRGAVRPSKKRSSMSLCSHSPNDVPPEPQRNASIAAVRGAVRPSKRKFKDDCVLFMIEIHRMMIAHAHLMVCELFYIRRHLYSKNRHNFVTQLY